MERVVAVHVPRAFILDVTCADGTRRETDMEPELWGEVYEPLRDPAFFARATVDPELGTVVWPNGADVAPEFLYHGDENPYAAFLAEAAEPEAEPSLSGFRTQ